MKKKQIALLLAALLCISPAAEGVAVMGAEFSSGEETAEVQNTGEETRSEAAVEIADLEVTEPAELTEDADEIWTSGEEISDFDTGEAPEVDAFTSEDSDALTGAAEAAQGLGNYEVAYITEEQYNSCLQSEERPEVETKMIENTTLSNALNSIEGENTGYCLVVPHDLNGEEDIVVPAGLNVFVGYAEDEDVKIRSITPNGNITFWGVGNEKESIEIKEGQGTVGFRQLYTSGEIKGSGSNDTVVFYEDAFVGSISGVENIHFGKECRSFNIRGTSEFYNLYNDTGCTDESWAVWLHIEGYSEKKVPVFHKTFDWGSGEFEGENGEHWSGEYGIGIQYFESFDVKEGEEWKLLDIGQNKIGAKFAMPDTDIIEMLDRTGVSVPENWYQLDMDGKTWNPGEHAAVEIKQFQECEGMSAQEIFEAYGRQEFPEAGCVDAGVAPSIALAERYMTAHQKKNNTEGYYFLHIEAEAGFSGTLTVPDGVKALKVEGTNNYDESTGTDHFVPINISSVNVPAGKKLSLFRILIKSNNMTFTGSGEAELQDARLNANVTADKLQVSGAAVKSLNCSEMVIPRNSRLVVSEYLNFQKAEIDAEDSVIYGQPGAYLKMGEISVPESDSTQSPDIFVGVNGKNRAQIYFGGNINVGKFTYEGKEYSRNIVLRQFDEKAALNDGALCAKDCFNDAYNYDGYDNETDNWWNYTLQYNGEKQCLATIGSTADADKVLEALASVFRVKAENGELKYCKVEPRYLHLDEYKNLTDGIDGNKRLVFYSDWWSNEEEMKAVEIPAYYEVSGQSLNSIASAQISAIKTQLYAGKAITPSVTVTLNGKKLKAGTDYTVSYANNTKAGSTASVIITGKGNYVGTAIQNFEIAAIPAKGKVYTVGSLKYKVTKSAYKNGTVSVYAPTKKTLTSVTVPATVKINGYTFQVTAIGNNAFSGCTKLKSVKIGSKVTSIGKLAFNGCKVLTSITISTNSLKTVGSSALKGISAKAVIKVPAAKLSAYQKLLKGKGQKASVKITK